METPQNYDPAIEEPKLQQFWEEKGVYKFDPNSTKPIYSVDTPPPTVSGEMHLGHSFSYSQQDFIVRYHRMTGKNIFYPFGTDDNGLPTERLIEKTKKVKAAKMQREEFINLCLDTLKEIRPKFVADWKRIGMSCDFSIFYSTIDDHSRKISQKSFLDLYKMGREYRKESPTIWCPECQTAIAQVELEDRDFTSFFNDIIFKVEGKEVIIATTRPEMLPACVAVFAHPEDARYKPLFGKKAEVPLMGFKVPIMADERADPAKGTGLVMCCTFGDQTDIEWYKAHNLPLKIAITKDGRMTELTGKYKDMKIEEARKLVIEDLKQANLLVKQTQITHPVNVHERCGTPIEILETKQWFIKYLDLKEKFIEAGKDMTWYPDYMRHRYDNWILGLQWDWCISRQRYFGVPFPVWYCKKCDSVILAEEDQLPVDPLYHKPKKACPKCGSKEFVPEKDVLDTWATSSLTPQISTSLFKDHPIYSKLYPMTLRPQAHDIITFWLFNTVVKSQIHNNIDPWQNIVISGWALDPHGKKFSKSKGNAIPPQPMIAKYGADSLRYWAAGSKLGDNMPFQEKDLVTGKKTVTKLWNASKFAFMHLQDYKHTRPKLQVMDRWLLSKLQKLIAECTESFENYEYSKTKAETDVFFWHTLCDNYLEIAKDRLYNPDQRGAEERKSAQYALYTGLLTVLKLFAPIMPHITESVYQTFYADKERVGSIHISQWPQPDKALIDDKAELAGNIVVDIINVVRKFKAQNNLSIKADLENITINCHDAEQQTLILSAAEDLKAVIKTKSITFGKQEPDMLACENYPIKLKIKLA
jgi:valyl-tRNA synthetase